MDAVYHVLYDELDAAVRRVCGENPKLQTQLDDWVEMVEQKRLRPYSELVTDLITT
ncbi:hypothetical protein SAMN05443637_105261 [Pseudonocardia thermophila]|uniref:Uncharacterized protein n=1 Tax=Pseudonocardia thermophila TaxID=1848 RepID=A0A1M6S0Z8_PSETH|nr:hypothetical protein SAMN05443637_105261 [Pseudonocardia thermophila]